jgi:hypothetical protein
MSRHGEAAVAETKLPPSHDGSVVMDIGGDIGAIVVYTPDELVGIEIEIIRRGEMRAFVHTEVRERRLVGGSIYAGVFPGVPAGDYSLVPIASLPPIEFSVSGGHVCELNWVRNRAT